MFEKRCLRFTLSAKSKNQIATPLYYDQLTDKLLRKALTLWYESFLAFSEPINLITALGP
jgi:hypothetical protein